MKKRRSFPTLIVMVLLFLMQGCGPIIFSPYPDAPPPPWFYPHRVETVRYVYFPEYLIYYDLSLRNYIYLDNGVWVTVHVLPSRYHHIDLRRSRFVHIRDYRGDDISRYHRENNSDRGNVHPSRDRN